MPSEVITVLCPAAHDRPAGIAVVEERAEVRHVVAGDLDAALVGADALFVWDFFSRALPAAWPSADRLRWVHVAAAGVDRFLLPALVRSDVVLTNARGVFDRPIADWDIVVKWLFDKIVGTLALIALSPLMIATAIAVKLDSKGPVLFRQKRYGFNNEMIEVLKFRSLYHEMSDFAAAKRFVESTKLFQLAVSLGAVESLIEQPASMSHASYDAADRAKHGISDGLVRLSVGLEAFEDLQADLEQALAAL